MTWHQNVRAQHTDFIGHIIAQKRHHQIEWILRGLALAMGFTFLAVMLGLAIWGLLI